MLNEKIKITIYSTSDFMGNVTKIEGTFNDMGQKDYAQYNAAPFITFTPRGKRTAYIKRATYNPYLLVIEGWGHPQPADFLNEGTTDANGTTVRESRYRSFDDGYKTDFDSIINPYLSGKDVIMDIRQTVGTNIMNQPVLS